MADEFSVYIFFPDESYIAEARFIDAESAVRLAWQITLRPAASLGIISRVIITDGGDCINMEWTYGKGITYPKMDQQTNQN